MTDERTKEYWEQRCEHVKMALFEAGFPEEAKQCRVGPAGADPNVLTIYMSPTIPSAIIWQTAKVTGGIEDTIPCWSCFMAAHLHRNHQIALDCVHGNCRNPNGAKEPPREELFKVSNRQGV